MPNQDKNGQITLIISRAAGGLQHYRKNDTFVRLIIFTLLNYRIIT
jgi:hypothetical protein